MTINSAKWLAVDVNFNKNEESIPVRHLVIMRGSGNEDIINKKHFTMRENQTLIRISRNDDSIFWEDTNHGK